MLNSSMGNGISAANNVGKTAEATTATTADVPVITGEDAARAFVATGSTVTAHDITVNAKSSLLLDLMAFTASGGTVAVSTTVAVGITHANAVAYTESGSTLTATGDVEVTSWTGSTTVNAPAGSDEAKRNAAFEDQVDKGSDQDDLGNIENVFSGRSVRVVGAAGAAGMVGVSPCVAVLILDSNSYAYIAGNVTKAANVTVEAETHFPVAATATFGLAAGAVAVSASAAVIMSNGIVYSGIVGAATVQHVSGKVSVLSDTTFDATTFAASLAAGAIAVNGAVAVSVDHMTINTFVGQATTLNDIGELVVKASTGDTGITSHATIIGGSAGAIAVKVGVAVATIRPTILTYVGTTPLVDGRVKSATAGAAGTNVQSEVKKLTITNDIKTKGQALTLGITAGAISVGTNVLVVSNDTCARAGIFSKNIKVAGGTTIDANFSATADTKLLAIDAGGIAVGVNVFISNLTADNRAVVDTTGSTVETGSLSVYAGRKTNPNTTVANADGLASVNAVIAISVNVAKANNATVNNAEVIGTGKLDVKRGTLNVEANGRATADAQMKSGVVEVSGVKIVSNVVYADLDAVQEARLENAAITTGGGSVNIVSNFNLETGSGSNTVQYGATAFVGPNGANCDKDGKPVNSKGKSVSVELVGVKVSVARANMNATVRAIADGVTLNTAPDTGARGAVNVKVDARSHATADAILPTVSIALVNVGVLDIRSEALGTFEAILGVFGENKVGVTNVTCDYKSDSYAGNGPVGGLSASIIDVSVNAARSKTGTIANAGLTGTGTLDVAGTINVKTTGDSVAKVEGRTYNVSISGIKVLTNDVEANQSVEQSAYSTFAGKLEAPQSALSISSLLGTASNPIAADATVGSSAGASISLYADITVNKAKTNSTSTNKAYIEGAGRESTEYNVGTASISATTYSKSSATAKTCLAISLYATIGDLDARANSSDSVTASVSNLALDSASDVNVTGYGKSDVYATAVTKGSVGGTSVEEIAAHTQMGSDKHKQSVKAKIGENTDINAKRNVKVEAKNFGMTEGAIDGGKSVGITSEVDLEFSSNANFDTNATVGENATVNADGNISILAESKPEAASDASASSISLTVSTDKTHSEATTVMNVGTSIGSGAKLAAKGAVIIIARGNVRQETISDADAKGIFGGDGAIEAYSNLDRTVTTTIGDGATIAANHGNVDVKAVAGDEDHITNESYVESGAFVGISAVMTHANINSTATTTVGKGVTIEDTFGYVNIISDSSMRYFYNTASCDARGVGAHPDAETDTFVTIKSNVNVGASGDKTFITGRYVTIDSLNSTMKVIDRTYAYGAAAGAKVRAYTDLLAHVDNKTAVNNAVIRGYDSVAVRSTSAPKIDNVGRKSDGKNVYATSYTAIYAAGKANSYAYMNKDVATFTTLVEMGGTTILGADIDVVSSNNLKYGPDPDGYKSSHLASLSKHSSTPIAKNVTATVTLNAGNAYYVGDAAAGIVIDIDGTESKPQVSAVGLRGETPIWSIVDNTVHIGKISNPLKGTIDVSSELKGKKTKVGVDARNVYDQNMIPYVLILNHTSLDVSLGAITVENANYLSPSVNGASVKNTNKTSVKGGIDEHGATTNDPVRPEVVVINYGTGNVTTTGLIANQTGTVSFTWTDADNNGSLFAGSDPVTTMNMVHSVAPIWANRFVVDGAKDIGTESVRMELYATWVGNDKPTTSVKATGDVWFGITDVIIVVGEAPSNGTARDSAVEVSNIEGKNTDLVVNVAMTIYRSADSPIISMPTPGTLEYTSDKIANLASDTCINADALDAYLVGETESEKTFLLPNGTVIHTDLDGVVTRIIEGGIDVTFDDYVITATVDGDLIATLGKGVAINLSTGVITIDEDASLDMLLSSLDGNWLKAIVEKDGTEIVVYDSSKPVTITDGESGNPMTVPKAISLKAVKLTELNGITYYQLTGSGASLDFASYTIDAAFGNSNSNSITAVLATGSTDKLLQWITSWDQSDKDSKLPVWQIVGIVNKLLTDEDFYGTVSEEDIDTDDDLVSWLPSWSNFNDWLIGKLKNPDYATVVAELDALAGEGENALSTKLADANFKDGLVWQWILDHAESEPESAGSEDGQSGEALSGEAQGGEVLNGEAQGGVSRIAKTPEYFLEALFTIEDYKTVIAQIGTPGSAISGEGSQYISDEERQQVIDQILASTILGEWLFDKLSEDTYADVLAQLDDAYGDVISNYLKADMTQDDCVKLVNWILANGKFDDDGLKNLVLALVVKSDYDEKSELVECLPAWSGFGEWLLAKLNGAEPDVLDEIDALADDASDKLSAKLADEGFTGDQAWQWIQDHVRREHSADYYLALLVTDEDYAYGKDAKADKLLSNGVTTTFVEWLAERLLLEGNEELLANADDDYVYDASELLAHGTADELANWFEQNVPDIKKISIVSALLDKKDLTFIIYPKIGIAADGTSITDFTILSEWLYERLTSGLPAASEVIDELKGLTNAEFTGCVYLLSYDKNSKTVGAWQVAEAAKTSTGVAKDYLDINWGGDLKVSLNDGLVFSEIWGGDKFIGFLLKQGPSEPKDENGYDRFGMNVDAVKGILATPDSIEVDDFLGTGTTVYLTPTYARNGVRITNTSIKENVITGISECKMMATATIGTLDLSTLWTLTAISKTAEGYYYIDWAKAQQSDEYKYSADVRSFYEKLRNVIWTQSVESTFTSMTVKGMCGNKDPKTYTHEYSNDYVTSADLYDDEDCLRFAYLVGKKKDKPSLFRYVILHPYEHWVKLSYINLMPADVILEQNYNYTEVAANAEFDPSVTYYVQDISGSRYVKCDITEFDPGKTYYTASPANVTLSINQADNEGASASAGSIVTVLGPVDEVKATATTIPADTTWASGSSSHTGYKITEALYVANDGTYYFREPTDLEGFVQWFGDVFGAKEYTTDDEGVIEGLLKLRASKLDDTAWLKDVKTDKDLTERLFVINIALLADDYANVSMRAQAALNKLNDTANYPQWLARQIANKVTNADRAFKALKTVASISSSISPDSFLKAGDMKQAWYRPADNPQIFATADTVVTTPVANRGVQASTVTLTQGQKIYLEVLSPEVARTVDGTYYVKANGSENYASDSAAIDDQPTVSTKPIILDDGTEVNARVESYNVTYQGVRYLTINRYYDENGDFFLLEYELKDGTKADSNGNVTPSQMVKWADVQNAGSEYALSNIVGENVKVTILDGDDGAKLVNGDPKPAIVGDHILIVTGDNVGIGTVTDWLSTAPYSGEHALVEFETLQHEENIIVGNVWLETDGSIRLPDNLQITEGSSYHHEATQDIIYTTIDVDKNGNLDLVAERNVTGITREDGVESYVNVAEGGYASLYAGNKNTFNTIIAADGAAVYVKGKAGITGNSIVGQSDADLMLSSDGDINSADHYLVVDLPEGNALNIAHVNDYYLVGVEAANSGMAQGRDENGEHGSGYDMGGLGNEGLETAIVSSDSAELAAWILAHIEGHEDDVIALLDAAAADPCSDIIATGDVDGFAEWLTRQMEQGTLDDAYIASLVDALVSDADVPPVTAEDMAEAIVADSDNFPQWLIEHLATDADAVAELNALAPEDPIDSIVASGDVDALAAWLKLHLGTGSGSDEGESASGDPASGEPGEGESGEGDPTSGGPVSGDPTSGDPTSGDPTEGGPGEDDPTEDEQVQVSLIALDDIKFIVAAMVADEVVESNEIARAAYIESVLADSENLAAWLVSHLANSSDAVAALDEAAAEQVDSAIAARDSEVFANWIDIQKGQNEKGQSRVDDALFATIVAQLLTSEDLDALERAAWESATYPETESSRIDDLRGLSVSVGESTGSSYVENLGDIAITQHVGTMTVGNVTSQFGDVALINEDGDIIGSADETVNVQGNDIELDAAGSVDSLVIETGAVDLTAVGTIENVISGATPAVAYDSTAGAFITSWNVDYEQIANYNEGETGSLAFKSGGTVDITEKTDNLGVDTVEASGTVELAADSFSDARADGKTEPNITAEGVTLTAAAGDIGSADKPIEIDTNGEGGAVDNTVNAVATGDVNLTETSGDMLVGAIVADGDVNLVVKDGDLVDADADDLVSKLAELLEEARIAQEQSESAAESARLREETLQQLLEAYEDAQAKAQDAQKAAEQAQIDADQATQDAKLAKDASDAAQKMALDLKDAEQALADAQKMAQDLEDAEQALADAQKMAQDLEDAEQAVENLKQQIADELFISLDEVTDEMLAERGGDVLQALADVKQAIADTLGLEADDVTDEMLAQRVEAAEQALADVKQVIADALEVGTDDVTDEMLAQRVEAAEQALADVKQQIADKLSLDVDTINDKQLDELAANALLEADRAAAANAAAQEVLADALQDLADAQQAEREAKKAYEDFKDIVDAYKKTAEDKADEAAAAAAAAQNIQQKLDASEPAITTGGDLNVTADNVGTAGNALSTNVGGQLNVNGDSAGNNVGTVNVENAGDLTTGAIAANDKVSLTATGNVQVNNDDDSVADVAAAKVEIRSVGGDVGSKDNPVSVDSNGLDAYGNNVFVKGFPDLNVDSVVAEQSANLSADGDVNDTNNGAGVVANDANITAGGNIGSDDNPLDVNADNLATTSGGKTNVNLTSPSTKVNMTADDDINITSTGSVQGKSKSQNLDINADGSVGSSDDSFVANVAKNGGVANAKSNYGETYLEKHPAMATMTLDLGGGMLDGKTGIIEILIEEGDVFILPLPTREGYRFLYWQGSMYYAGDGFDVIGNHLFTAIWEKIEGNEENEDDDDDDDEDIEEKPDNKGDENTEQGNEPESPYGATGTNAGSGLPQTGDYMPAVPLVLLASVALLFMVLSLRRRQRS